MLLTRKYHFYAAHRNQDLNDRCFSPHGHRYGIRVIFDLQKTSSITTLFSELDAKVKPYLDQYDHSWLIDKNDPLYAYLKGFKDFSKFRFVEFDAPTSVENLAIKLYTDIRAQTGLNVYAVEVDETDSSTLKYVGEHTTVFDPVPIFDPIPKDIYLNGAESHEPDLIEDSSPRINDTGEPSYKLRCSISK